MRFFLFAILNFFLAATAVGSTFPQGLSGRDHATSMLLLSESDFDVRLGAKSLYRSESSRPEILDLVAEIAWTACAGNRAMDPDTLAWLTKTLGDTKQARFAPLLDYCLTKANDEKVRKYAKLAREQIAGEDSHPFEGGKLDLHRLRMQLSKRSRTIGRNELGAKFDGLRKTATVDEIYSALGEPDSVSGVNSPKGKAGFLYVRVRVSQDMLELGYNGLGTIRFYSGADKDWLLDEAKSDRGLYWSRQAGGFLTIEEAVDKGDGPELRDIARELMKRENISRDTLEHIASRIHASRLEGAEDMSDALAWLCKVIQKSQDGRYKKLLLEVSETAADGTLRKYAAKAANSLPETTEAVFVPPSQ